MKKPTWYLAPYSCIGGYGGGRQAPHSILAYRNGKGISHHRVAEMPVDHDSARNTSNNIRDVLKDRHGGAGGYLVVGGDHSITTGIIEAREKCHLVLFDAHSDDYGERFGRTFDHGNWVNEVVDQNLLTGITWFNYRNEEFDTEKCRDLIRDIPMDGKVHVSVDIDVLEPHYYNWASAFPESGGCSLDQLLKDIASVKSFNQDISLDFVEYDPVKDLSQGGAYASSLIIDCLLDLIDA